MLRPYLETSANKKAPQAGGGLERLFGHEERKPSGHAPNTPNPTPTAAGRENFH
jgi:hypothetical protein